MCQAGNLLSDVVIEGFSELWFFKLFFVINKNPKCPIHISSKCLVKTKVGKTEVIVIIINYFSFNHSLYFSDWWNDGE